MLLGEGYSSAEIATKLSAIGIRYSLDGDKFTILGDEEDTKASSGETIAAEEDSKPSEKASEGLTILGCLSNIVENIILQEMEKLSGILIATTNLTQNLDKAFERRFLYKIKFNKPGLAPKTKIWKSMIPDLSEEEARELAEGYDFSGGQIENISRKKMIKSILDGVEPDFSEVKSYCGEELIEGKGGEGRKIGF